MALPSKFLNSTSVVLFEQLTVLWLYQLKLSFISMMPNFAYPYNAIYFFPGEITADFFSGLNFSG